MDRSTYRQEARKGKKPLKIILSVNNQKGTLRVSPDALTTERKQIFPVLFSKLKRILEEEM